MASLLCELAAVCNSNSDFSPLIFQLGVDVSQGGLRNIQRLDSNILGSKDLFLGSLGGQSGRLDVLAAELSGGGEAHVEKFLKSVPRS